MVPGVCFHWMLYAWYLLDTALPRQEWISLVPVFVVLIMFLTFL